MRTWVRSRRQVSGKITLGDEVAIAVEFVCCGQKECLSFLSANPKYGNNTWQYYEDWNAIRQAIGSKKPSRHEGKKAYREAALGPKRKEGDGRIWMVSI